jgi:hypothetical protein
MSLYQGMRSKEKDATKRCYPGGSFDPMGMSKGDLATMQLKELKVCTFQRERQRERETMFAAGLTQRRVIHAWTSTRGTYLEAKERERKTRTKPLPHSRRVTRGS